MIAIAIAAAAAVWWPRGAVFVLEQSADQNVLLITIDTLRADALASYGGRTATPNMDRLAGRGSAVHVRARARRRDASLFESMTYNLVRGWAPLRGVLVIDRDLHTASELFQNGQVARAIDLLDSVIARRPDTADAYVSLAHAYWETGRLRQAITTLEDALKHGAPDREVRIRLGLYLAESQVDTARAIKLLQGMPADDVEALNGLGVAYGGAGRYEDAIRSFDRVLTLDPTNGLAYQNLASMVLSQALRMPGLSQLERTQRLQQAVAHARQAIEIDPVLGKAQTTLGAPGRDAGPVWAGDRGAARSGGE